MKIELCRMKNNHMGIFFILVCILMEILGLILLISLDGYHYNQISMGLLQYSIYTVYTQFGFFIFPIFSIYYITTDYKEKNIVFYKLAVYREYTYYLCKLFVLIAICTLGNFIVAFSVSVTYGNFSNLLLFFLKIMNVSIFIILTSLFYAFIFKNIMISYCINFVIWVMGVIVYSMNNAFNILCYYDATLKKHSMFKEIFEKRVFMHNSIIEEIGYNLLVFMFIMILVVLFKKRWIKNGI